METKQCKATKLVSFLIISYKKYNINTFEKSFLKKISKKKEPTKVNSNQNIIKSHREPFCFSYGVSDM